MKNMTLDAIARATNGQLFYPDNYIIDNNKTIAGVVTDNRQIQQDYLFIPIIGAKVDGHSFIDKAFEMGAAATLSMRKLDNCSGPYILVDNTEQALKDIATYYRKQLTIPIIGVIGSVGKTSTKEMLYSVLSEKYNVLKTEGNFNNEIGLPLTICRITDEHTCAVVEMGISEFGEMDRLGAIACPDVVVMTNIGQAHLENLGTRSGILKAKSEVFAHMNKSNGFVVLNGDDDKLIEADTLGIEKAFYGCGDNNSYRASILSQTIDSVTASFTVLGDTFTVVIPLPGAHNVYNAAAACAVATHLKMDSQSIAAGISKASTISGRNNIIKSGNITIIDDCYNASPASMEASLKTLSYAKGRKIAVLGDMAELGTDEVRLHYDLGKAVADNNIDVLFTFGPLSAEIANCVNSLGYKCEIHSIIDKNNLDELISEIKTNIQSEDTILIKASHCMNFSKIVKDLI